MTEFAQGWFTEASEELGCAFSLRLQDRLHEEQTPFQHIAIYETTTFGTLMVIDGFVMLSDRDNFLYHEMMTHPVLFTHPAPRDLLIVGGGDCGTLREALRHDELRRVVQVEIDERVTRLAEQYFPQLCESNHDPRAQLLFDDAIEWVRNAPAESLDVIIVDSTDPVGPAQGLFSEGFFRDALRALRPGGLIVQQSESPLLHMSLLRDMYRAMGGAGFVDVRSLQFPQPVYPSGWWSATMAMKPVEGNAADHRRPGTFREQAVKEKGFETRYYSADIHRAAFAMPAYFYPQLERELSD